MSRSDLKDHALQRYSIVTVIQGGVFTRETEYALVLFSYDRDLNQIFEVGWIWKNSEDCAIESCRTVHLHPHLPHLCC